MYRAMTADTPLPEKPSAFLRLALADLAKAETSDRYEIDTRMWHMPSLPSSPVAVGLAGAVMAFSLGCHRQYSAHPRDFDDDSAKKLQAIQLFHEGRLVAGLASWGGVPGLRRLGKPHPLSLIEDMPGPDYDSDPAGYRRHIESVAARLEELGL